MKGSLPMENPKGLSDWTVLVVDDDALCLEIVTNVLGHYGATVHTAANGQEGLDVVQQVNPTLVLADLSMPILDGWEMLKQLRANPQTRNIPVVALTAHALAGNRERALSGGFQEYLTKPFKPSGLLANLLQAMEYASSVGKE